MNPSILVIDDNKDILFNITLLLKEEKYDVITAKNGEEGLKVLSKLKILPEVIICDIMMPKMDGYDFFSKLSNDPRWNNIPFIFLTARATPEDIRFGKLLGVDDYLTKPFESEDLLCTIQGKINRNQRTKLINTNIKKILSSRNIDLTPVISSNTTKNVNILLMKWDDAFGPRLELLFPKEQKPVFSFQDLGKQLFQSSVSIYGHLGMKKNPEGILLNIKNIKKKGYLYFDSHPARNERFGEKQYMFAIIAPRISYFQSLKIKEILKDFSKKIKENKKGNIKKYWEKITQILIPNEVELSPTS